MNKNASEKLPWAESLVCAIGNNRLENFGNDIDRAPPECTAGLRAKCSCTICLAARDLPCFQAGFSWGNSAVQDLPQAYLHSTGSRCAASGILVRPNKSRECTPSFNFGGLLGLLSKRVRWGKRAESPRHGG